MCHVLFIIKQFILSPWNTLIIIKSISVYVNILFNSLSLKSDVDKFLVRGSYITFMFLSSFSVIWMENISHKFMDLNTLSLDSLFVETIIFICQNGMDFESSLPLFLVCFLIFLCLQMRMWSIIFHNLCPSLLLFVMFFYLDNLTLWNLKPK